MASGSAKPPAVELSAGDRDVRISNPDRVYFPDLGITKLDLAQYYLSVGDGIVNALRSGDAASSDHGWASGHGTSRTVGQ